MKTSSPNVRAVVDAPRAIRFHSLRYWRGASELSHWTEDA